VTGETVVLAAFHHESNSFVSNPAVTTRADFGERYEYTGQEVVERLRGTGTEVGGIVDVAEEAGVDLRPIVAASATPGAPVERETYEHYAGEILNGIEATSDSIDGVLLSLHGAMVTEHLNDPEGTLTARVRDLVGPDIPISVTLDLHGNVTSELVEVADSIVGYEEYPHLDMAETGRRGTRILVETMRGTVTPTTHVERPPQVIFQPKAYTPSGPMADIVALAREYQERDGVLATNVFVGYYHADVPGMGVTTPVVTDDDPALAREIARDLAATLWRRRDAFVEDYPGADEAVAEAKRLARHTDDGPIVMADFGSNPGGGGASDGTTIPRALLERNVPNAGYALMYDPAVVDRCLEAGVGATLTVTLGGKTDGRHGDPIEDLEVYVTAITDGRYVNTGTSHGGTGVQNDLGPTVHLECGPNRELHVVVTGVRASAFDAEVWRHVGIQPERLDVLCIPSFVAFLGDYASMASDVVLADTPGASAVDPRQFEYQHIPRPLYPLDDLTDDHYPEWDEA
jgi:microcystin degradation protein MlrC